MSGQRCLQTEKGHPFLQITLLIDGFILFCLPKVAFVLTLCEKCK